MEEDADLQSRLLLFSFSSNDSLPTYQQWHLIVHTSPSLSSSSITMVSMGGILTMTGTSYRPLKLHSITPKSSISETLQLATVTELASPATPTADSCHWLSYPNSAVLSPLCYSCSPPSPY